jgi:plasmid stability protein
MATIVIRKLDETVKRKLQVRAARNGRSMEAEAREILSGHIAENSVQRKGGLGTAIHRRFAAIGGADLQIPPRRFSTSLSDGIEIPELDGGLGTAIHELFAPLGGVNLRIPPRRKSHRPIPDFS